MPRKPDAQTESRILNAAYELWSRGGEHAVTMRAVANAAGTTTPTLYERFKDKKDLVTFLRERSKQNMVAALQPCQSVIEICCRALEFTLAHGHEYRLLTVDWAGRLSRNETMPSYALVKQRLAEELGRTPDQHERLALALVEIVHGTALLLLGPEIDNHVVRELKEACLESCGVLIENASKKSSARKRPRRSAGATVARTFGIANTDG
jgi:AcrR family transcriptional regulator